MYLNSHIIDPVVAIKIKRKSEMGENERRLTEEERLILDHEMEEWKYLNDYVNKMDMGYMQLIALLLAIITGIMAIAFSDEEIMERVQYVFFLIPPVLISTFGYLSYQFRITAILRGHLSALETSMNNKMGKKVHMWNSALVETFMAHNNMINNCFMPVNFVTVAIMVIIAWRVTHNISSNLPNGEWIFILYWVFIIVAAIIVIVPFFYNGRIRCETENTDRVNNAYEKYLAKRKAKEKEYKYKGINLNENEESE